MPRLRRLKSEQAIYHIMARSISEVDLFKTDDDKKKYMYIIKEYQKIYKFKVYAYCLMDNHLHLIVDSNGADISKIMHCINFKYAMYFNTIHKRHGHLFQDRFKSKMVEDNRYLIALSAYIHNNPVDISLYANNPEDYQYSSLSIYLGLNKDPFRVIDEDIILEMFSKNKYKAKNRYMQLVLKAKTVLVDTICEEETEFESEKTDYRSERRILVRNFDIEAVIQFILDRFKIERPMLYIKNKKETVPAKSMLILLLRGLCGASCKEICAILGNLTAARISSLSTNGIKLINNNETCKNMMDEFIQCYC